MRRALPIALLLVLGCKDKYRDAAKQAAAARDAGSQVKPEPANAELLAWGQNMPRDLQVDGQSLFWINEGRRAEGKPGLMTVSKTGGEVKVLADGKGLWALALDEAHVYFVVPENLSVHKVPKSGGQAVTLAQEEEGLSGIATDATHVYWTGVQNVTKVEKAGGKPQLVADELSVPSGLHLDDANAYWYSSTAGKLARVAKKGGKPSLFYDEQEATLHQFVGDATHLYWTYGAAKKALFKRMAKAGGKPETVLQGLDPAADVTLDATHLYWNTEDAIFKAPKQGGAVEKIVDGCDRAMEIAVDDQHVYWVDRIGRVQRMKK